MKKILPLILVALILLSPLSAARAFGAVIIPAEDADTLFLDDMKLNKTMVIDDWGEITLKKYEIHDELCLFSSEGWWHDYYSGKESDYAVLYVNIINNALTPHDYLAEKPSHAEPVVKFIYDDTYQYEGWAYQVDWDWDEDGDIGLNPDLNFPIGPMYAGHYMFGCTLPNAVINGKKPLQMIFIIDDMVFTYNIRK